MKDEENKIIHHSMKGSAKTKYQHKMEDWENAKVLTIVYSRLLLSGKNNPAI